MEQCLLLLTQQSAIETQLNGHLHVCYWTKDSSLLLSEIAT